jgi:hypothetical protein
MPSRRDKKDESIQRRDEKDKSVEKREDKSPVRRTPAKKKRARKISSGSGSEGSDGSGSSSDSSSSSSSSEDEAMAEDRVIEKSEEEQLRVLGEKQAARKKLKSRMKEKATRRLIRRAKRYVVAQRKAQEAKKEAEETKTEQQEEEAESSEADPAATEWVGRDRKERCIKRIVREQHIKERLGKLAPPVTRETSEAVVDKAKRVCRPDKPAPPTAGEITCNLTASATHHLVSVIPRI